MRRNYISEVIETMIPIAKPFLGEEEAAAVKEVILSGWLRRRHHRAASAAACARRRPRWRTREQHVARLERHELRDERDDLGDQEDHLLRARRLHRLARHQGPDAEILRVGDLVRGDERRAERGEVSHDFPMKCCPRSFWKSRAETSFATV